jgi:hypothetical protein
MADEQTELTATLQIQVRHLMEYGALGKVLGYAYEILPHALWISHCRIGSHTMQKICRCVRVY